LSAWRPFTRALLNSPARRIIGKHLVLLDILVQNPLQPRHLGIDDALNLVGQFALDVLLQSTEEERPKHLVQTLDDEELFFFVQVELLARCIGERGGEPLVE
jgi:hypothetical protein